MNKGQWDWDKERHHLLHEIQKWQFRAVELNLFLDTHPEDQRALGDYNQAVERLSTLRRTYEERYGPLTNFGWSPSGYPWAWINDPWPWDIGM